MTGSRSAADEARREFHEILERKGHAVDNARFAIALLERAFAEGALQRTQEIDTTLADLTVALEQDAGQKLGGKSAEAARFITRRLELLLREAPNAVRAFLIEDELHDEPVGRFDTLGDALTEVRRIARVPWGTPPNVAPCVGGSENCGRHYEIVEYDAGSIPWQVVGRIDALRVEAGGEVSLADLDATDLS